MATAPVTPLLLSFEDARAMESATLRGAKGRGLALMSQRGMPVPPGFTLTTAVARYVMAHDGHLPPATIEELRRAMADLERKSGCRFGDAERPLLVSARSGAADSMPGMMETILDIGLTEATYPGIVACGGRQFAEDCRLRLHTIEVIYVS